MFISLSRKYWFHYFSTFILVLLEKTLSFSFFSGSFSHNFWPLSYNKVLTAGLRQSITNFFVLSFVYNKYLLSELFFCYIFYLNSYFWPLFGYLRESERRKREGEIYCFSFHFALLFISLLIFLPKFSYKSQQSSLFWPTEIFFECFCITFGWKFLLLSF